MMKELTEKDKRELVFGIHDSEERADFFAWTDGRAKRIAKSMGIELTYRHWQVIHFIRTHYLNVGADSMRAHDFSHTLEERFAEEGGMKYLYELFPDGPLNQGCRIAGVPIPHDTVSSSFGSVS